MGIRRRHRSIDRTVYGTCTVCQKKVRVLLSTGKLNSHSSGAGCHQKETSIPAELIPAILLIASL